MMRRSNSIILVSTLLTMFGVYFGVQPAMASHVKGAELSYVNIGPNLYAVKYLFYIDCGSSTIGNTTETLTYRAPGCNSTNRTLTLQRVSIQAENPYCSVTPCQNNNTLSMNPHLEVYFSGTLSLPGMCPNWTLSILNQGRSVARNLASGTAENLFIDALINNVSTVTNSSPVWGKLPNPVIGVDQTITYSHSVTEPDGDSLVHLLVPSLKDPAIPVSYSTYPAGVSHSGLPYQAGQFSGLNPLLSENPVQVNRQSGSISFKPMVHVPGTVTYHQIQNSYVIAYQVDEYRKVGNVKMKIGSIRRDVPVTVADFGNNKLPSINSILFNGSSYSNNSILRIRPNQTINIQFTSDDANAQDLVVMTSNNAAAIPGSSFATTAGSRPVGTFSWTPGHNHERTYPYYFTVTVTDNACPVNAFQTFTVGVVVSSSAPTVGISKNLPVNSFTAYPNPSNSSNITFKIKPDFSEKNAVVLIYNATGKVVDKLEVKTGAEQISWNKKADLPAGIYFARLTSDAGSQTIKTDPSEIKICPKL